MLILIFFIIWVLLSGKFSPLLLILGGISVIALWLASLKAKKNANYPYKFNLNLIKFTMYIPYLIKEIVLSNIHVAKLILTDRVNPNIVTCVNTFSTKSEVTVFCNSVNLTPGSFVLDANKERILIHVIDYDIEYSMLSHALENKVKSLKKVNKINK